MDLEYFIIKLIICWYLPAFTLHWFLREVFCEASGLLAGTVWIAALTHTIYITSNPNYYLDDTVAPYILGSNVSVSATFIFTNLVPRHIFHLPRCSPVIVCSMAASDIASAILSLL